MALTKCLEIPHKMAEKIVKDFLAKEEATLKLLDNSFLSGMARERYRMIFLDRVRAVGYRFLS